MATSTFSLGFYLTGKHGILLKYYPSFEAFRFYHCEITKTLVLPHAKHFASPLQIPTCYSYLVDYHLFMSIPSVTRSNTGVCGRSLGGIVA
jgi:hypothetical protein